MRLPIAGNVNNCLTYGILPIPGHVRNLRDSKDSRAIAARLVRLLPGQREDSRPNSASNAKGNCYVEYRFPLVDALIFGWPGRWGFTNVGGTAFFDAGLAWDNDLDRGFDNDDPTE